MNKVYKAALFKPNHQVNWFFRKIYAIHMRKVGQCLPAVQSSTNKRILNETRTYSQ